MGGFGIEIGMEWVLFIGMGYDMGVWMDGILGGLWPVILFEPRCD